MSLDQKMRQEPLMGGSAADAEVYANSSSGSDANGAPGGGGKQRTSQ